MLVAEDHEDTRSLLKTLLMLRGFGVVEAKNGEEAVELAEREHPDLILMDGTLPRLDGLSATRRLRALAAFREVPIIFLSAHAGEDAQAAALAAGCDECIIKPFYAAQLYSVLARRLAHASVSASGAAA